MSDNDQLKRPRSEGKSQPPTTTAPANISDSNSSSSRATPDRSGELAGDGGCLKVFIAALMLGCVWRFFWKALKLLADPRYDVISARLADSGLVQQRQPLAFWLAHAAVAFATNTIVVYAMYGIVGFLLLKGLIQALDSMPLKSATSSRRSDDHWFFHILRALWHAGLVIVLLRGIPILLVVVIEWLVKNALI